ncbi:MAG: hypothetical protein HYT35_00510 [Candidatus Staskawiczbacteria bacterium]|nr:hypothetical protein [Candidatus Staskawiczbacteria bacterium]
MIFEPKKRINRYEFNKILHSITDISDKERNYLHQSFNKHLVDGLTEYELKEKINKLQSDKKDILDNWELEQVKRKILGRLGK